MATIEELKNRTCPQAVCRRVPLKWSETEGGPEMKAHYLGHVVFYVRDLQRALAFYRDLLGFQEVGTHLQRRRGRVDVRPHSSRTAVDPGR